MSSSKAAVIAIDLDSDSDTDTKPAPSLALLERAVCHPARQEAPKKHARAAGGPFELEYTSLPGASGDEHWRANARGRTIRLTVTPSGERCTVLDAGDGGDPECRPDDLALAPFPRRDFVARPFEATFGFMQSWNSVPILSKDDAELHCYGS